jgi:hypothetical protein
MMKMVLVIAFLFVLSGSCAGIAPIGSYLALLE